MKKILPIIFLFLAQFVFAQNNSAQTSYSKLPSINEIVERSGIYNSMTMLLGEDSAPIPANRLVELLPDFINVNSISENSTVKLESELLKKHQPQIEDYLKSISSFGESDGVLRLDDVDRFPSGFVNYNNQLTFVQTGIYSDYSYNTLQLDATQRARKVVGDISLPSIYNLTPLMKVPEIKYFAIIVGYTARNFSSDSILDKDAETTAIIFSKLNAQKYIDAQITDEELLKLSIVYNINKATNNHIKKLSL